jgi:hypothetical protein
MPSSGSTLVVALAMVLSACDNTGPKSVQAKVRFLNGATPRAAGTGATLNIGAAPPANGDWLLSPDRMTLTLKRVFFQGTGSGTSQELNCPITYDKSKPGLTQLTDCPFAVDTGTYTAVSLTFAGPVEYFMNDATNGFYTTSTGFVTSAPAGGAQTFPFTMAQTTNGEWGPSPIELPAPVVVTDSSPLTLSVVVNGLQAFKVTVGGGTVTPTPGAVQTPGLVAATSAIAGVELYSNSGIATGESRCTFHCATATPNGVMSVAMYYTSPTTPVMAAVALNGPPTCMNGAVYSIILGTRSYIAQDASGNLGWALPADQSYATYASEMRMSRVSTVGGTTTLYCKARSGDPAPPGGSYASGAPAINQAANATGTFILVAK